MRTLGIDFGTTNSVVATVNEKGMVRPWAFHAPNSTLMRTVLTFVPQEGSKQRTEIGYRAYELGQNDPNVKSFSSWKRRLGEEELPTDDVFGETLNYVDLTAIFLSKMVEQIGWHDEPIQAVMTVPNNAPELQLTRMRLAAEAAKPKIEVLGWLKEPTAAAVAYGLHRSNKIAEGELVMVVDIGGGTFDVSIVQVTRQGSCKPVATRGVEKLGGDDWDMALAHHMAKDYPEVFAHPQALATFKHVAERVKRQLTMQREAVFDAAVAVEGNLIEILRPVTRVEFESVTAQLLEQVKNPIEQVLADHRFIHESIHHIVTVGGPSRMPAFRKMLKELFPASRIYDRINPDEVVAIGAARHCADVAAGEDTQVVEDVIGANIYIVTSQGHRKVFDRNDPLGVARSLDFAVATKGQRTATVEVIQSASDTRDVFKRVAKIRLEKLTSDRGGILLEVDRKGEVNLTVAASGKREHQVGRRIESPTDIDLEAVRRSVDEYVGYSVPEGRQLSTYKMFESVAKPDKSGGRSERSNRRKPKHRGRKGSDDE